MRTFLILAALLAGAASAQQGFQPAQPVHIEPLGEIEIKPGAVFADTVILKLTVDAAGSVTDAEIWSPSGNEAIDEAALEAATKCLFQPATQDGEPIESFYQIYYRLSAYRTREYLSAEEKAGTAEEAPPATAEHD
jgi:TonB family protein